LGTGKSHIRSEAQPNIPRAQPLSHDSRIEDLAESAKWRSDLGQDSNTVFEIPRYFSEIEEPHCPASYCFGRRTKVCRTGTQDQTETVALSARSTAVLFYVALHSWFFHPGTKVCAAAGDLEMPKLATLLNVKTGDCGPGES
jgi:hypothetical protein